MKIVGSHIQQILGAYLKPARKPEAAGVSAPTDEVSLSERASEILKARQAYDGLPDVREDRVADIRAKLQSGTYALDESRIAEAIVRGRPEKPPMGPDAE